jgi:2-oxoisovalerate dehydrogenase E1 component
MGLDADRTDRPVVVCSIGDAAMTEGEMAEALQMAVLKQLPIIYLVQDNEWDISASADEIRAMDATAYAKGFPGLEVFSMDGSDFEECYATVEKAITTVRTERRPMMIHAKVPLLNHHTSGRADGFLPLRRDLAAHAKRDPFPVLHTAMLEAGFAEAELLAIESEASCICCRGICQGPDLRGSAAGRPLHPCVSPQRPSPRKKASAHPLAKNRP